MSGQQSGPPQGGGWQQPGQGRPGAPGPGQQQPQGWGQPAGWGQQPPSPQGWSTPSTPPGRRSSGRGGALPTVAVVATLVSALVALVYGGYAIIARRGIFADLADNASVSVDDASRSDTVNGLLLAITLVVVLATIAVWVATLVVARRGRNALGLGGLGLVGVGAIAALVGGFLSSGVENVDDAGTAATGYVLVGVGFVLVALGNLVGAAGLRQGAPAPSAGPGGDDRLGGSGFGDGRPQQPQGYQPGQASGWSQQPPQPQQPPGPAQDPGRSWGQQPPGPGAGRPPQQGGWGQPPGGQQGGPGGWGPPPR
ncbi:MAG: hypothetical protein Q7T56_13660 [Nocardioidaceae bacterium]|nr:hypothetical protein [Nocardioidaceae bacterium]